MRGRLGATATGVLLLLAVGLAPGGRAAADPPVVPAAPAGLPASVEDLAPYVAQDSCDPVAKPGTLALARLLTSTYPDTSVIGTAYACGDDGPVSEHYEGRAVDWAIDRGSVRQVGEAHTLLSWLFGVSNGVPAANARRLGVMYAIYDSQIIGTYALAGGWRPYACAGVTGCHQDHVHLSLSWAGAQAQTSWWSGTVAATDYGPCVPAGFSRAPTPSVHVVNPSPCPASAGAANSLAGWSGATLGPGSSGAAVAGLQSALAVPADGVLGPVTALALLAFQAAHGLPQSGTTDLATWAALLAAHPGVTAQAPPPPATATGPGPGVAPVVAQSPPAPVTSRPPSPPARTPTAPARLRQSVLRPGATGVGVRFLQFRLHVPVTGRYGLTTSAAVRRFQRAHHLRVDGVVGPATWHALAR